MLCCDKIGSPPNTGRKFLTTKLDHDANKKILYGSYEGNFTLEDFEKQLIEIVSGASFPANAPTIWDLTKTDSEQFDQDFIQDVLDIRAKFSSRGDARIAIVAATDLTFGVSRMHAAHSDALPQTRQVLRTLEGAESWISDSEH